MGSHFDTIVAPITAPGRAAVAAVRVSGPEAYRIARAVFLSLPAEPEPRKALYGRYAFGDDGLALPFEEGASYTGEPAVELFLHGSPAAVRLLVDGCRAAGARDAEPGEFTLRAFANGRLDLSQAEAVAEVVGAQTGAHVKAAGAQLAGALTRALTPALTRLDEVIVRLEAGLDFSEEIGPHDPLELAASLESALAEVAEVRKWERPAALLRDGLRVAILGRPNAGKSSLFNAIAGSDRAIVTDIPGTTRDVLEATIDVRGVPVTLFDTAGLREDPDEVEAIGIARARSAVKRAHLVLYVFDCRAGLTAEDSALLAVIQDPVVVAAKADLPHQPTQHLETSSVTGLGMSQLLQRFVGLSECLELPFLLNARHAGCLSEAAKGLEDGIAALRLDATPDLVLPALYQASGALRQILGLGVAPDVIEQIFARFCIGK
ncbi:MAG TPA: tRNA uridine-5-carboxymethylaminomethyl(34) synthesis GTPase MnmE [Fimbriimonadaceae bacterium]|nr:tRNA uridine-5-carboxymethylaminomethyl(34) synthesis GTPase MnmE [Fimbriimonadaceae bacterium]